MNEGRVQYIDIAKCFAMILIIVGHSIVPGLAQNAIYSFHVPLFFFLSGIFISMKPCREVVEKKAARLLLPYAITSLLLVALYLVKSLLGHGTFTDVLKALVAALYCCGTEVDYGWITIPSCGAIWFLPALFIASLIVNYSLGKRHPGRFILIVALISWISARIFILPFGLQAGGFASLYVYAGHLEHKHLHIVDKIVANRVLLLPMALLWILCWLHGGLFQIAGIVSLPRPLLNLAGSFCGIYIVLSFCCILSRFNLTANSLLAEYGRNTMIVLCAHILEIRMIPWTWLGVLGGGHASFGQPIALMCIIFIRLGISLFSIYVYKHSKVINQLF